MRRREGRRKSEGGSETDRDRRRDRGTETEGQNRRTETDIDRRTEKVRQTQINGDRLTD